MPETDSARWLQGDTVPAAVVAHFVDEGVLEESWGSGWVVVASHSCDVGARDFEAEPLAEILLLKELESEAKDGNYMWGKNPRRLQLEVELAGRVVLLEADMRNRAWVDRSQLLGYAPDAERRLPTEHRRALARWMGMRYWREALPDRFNERLRPVWSAVRKAGKGGGGSLLARLFVALHTEEELADGDSYRLALRGVMEVEDYDDVKKLRTANEALQEIVRLIATCDDIEVVDWEVISMADMSLDDLKLFKAWGDFDDLSLRDDEGRLAPDGG